MKKSTTLLIAQVSTGLKTSPGRSLRSIGFSTAIMIVLGGNLQANPDTWTGGGADNNWMTSGNWGGTAPSANDNLIFSGTTRLSPSNNFTANTNFDGITFSSGAGAFSLGGNAIDLTGNITNNSSNAEVVAIGLVLQGPSTFTTTSNTTAAASTNISGNISGSGPLIIVGSNAVGTSSTTTASTTTLTLSGANSYTGATTLTGGNVTLSYGGSTANKLGNGSGSGTALTLGGSAGGVALTLNGAAATQTVASTVIAAGNSAITLGSGDVLNLGSVSGTDGGTLALDSASFGTSASVSAASNTNGILGGFSIWTNAASGPTVVDWVASSGSGSAATLGDFTAYNTGAASTWTSTANVSMSANQAPTSGTTINSLKFTATSTLTLSGANTITTGGILFPTQSSASSVLITGGTLTSSAADLYIYSTGTANSLTINSSITGSIGLVVAPISANSESTVTLGGSNNTFTGNIAVTRANLALNSALPSNTGDTITLNTVVASSTTTTLQDAETTGTLTINAVNYQIVGNGSVTKNNNTGNTLALLGAHAYTGVTTDSGGVLQIDTLANGGTNSSIGASSNAASNLVLASGATLQYIGSGGSTDHLFTISGSTSTVTLDGSGSGAANFTNTGAVAFSISPNASATLILTGTNTGANTLAAAYGNQGTGTSTLSKTGVGSWILSGASTYSGGTTVSAGTLQLGNGISGSISSSSALTMGGGTFIFEGTTSGGSQTVASLATTANTSSVIALNPDGSSNANTTTLTITSNSLSNIGAGSVLNFNLSGGTTDAATSTLGNTVVAFGTAPTLTNGIISAGTTVTDKGGAYFATVNGSNDVAGLTGQTGLPATGATSGVNYIVNSNTSSSTAGSLSLALSASEAANTVTVNTTNLSSGASLALGANTLTIAGGGGMLFSGANPYSITASGAGGLTSSSGGAIVINNYDSSSSGVTISAPIVANGSNAVTFAGTGTTTLSGSNNYSGATTVDGGTLNAAGSGTAAGGNGSLNSTSSVTVNSGGTLLFGATDAVKHSATLGTLASGLGTATISMQGLNGATETMGALTLNAGTTIIDFGSGSTKNTLEFSSLTINPGAVVDVYDWNGFNYYANSTDSGSLGSGDTQDRLLFTSLSGITQAELSQISFYSGDGTGFIGTGQEIAFPGGAGTPGYTAEVAVPEPSTVFAAICLLGLIGWRGQRRVRELSGTSIVTFQSP